MTKSAENEQAEKKEIQNHLIPVVVEEPDSKALFLRQKLADGDIEGTPFDIDQLLPSGHIMITIKGEINRRFVFTLHNMMEAVMAGILEVAPEGQQKEPKDG